MLFLKSHMLSNHLYKNLAGFKRNVQRFLKHIDDGKIAGYYFSVKNVEGLS